MSEKAGNQDVVDILTTDHHEVLALVNQIPTADSAQRRDMVDTVIAELVRHSVAEEMYVYPAMREHLPDGEDQVQHDIEEHQELMEVMKEPRTSTAGSLGFSKCLDAWSSCCTTTSRTRRANSSPGSALSCRTTS